MALNEKEILDQAKKIMDAFSDAMKNIDISDVSYDLVRTECMREEGEGVESDQDFISRFLSNAPQVKGNSILANKGSWVNK